MGRGGSGVGRGYDSRVSLRVHAFALSLVHTPLAHRAAFEINVGGELVFILLHEEGLTDRLLSVLQEHMDVAGEGFRDRVDGYHRRRLRESG